MIEMNDFDKGFMMGMAMSDDDPSQYQNEGCFSSIIKTLVYGALTFIGLTLAGLIILFFLIWLIGGR